MLSGTPGFWDQPVPSFQGPPPPPLNPRARAVGTPPIVPDVAGMRAMATIPRQPAPDVPQPAQVPEEEQPPSAPLPPAASPPTGGTIQPTVKPDTQLVKPEEDEELAKLTGTIDKLFPQVKPPERNPWAMAAMMIPAALGQPATALSMMEGYQ